LDGAKERFERVVTTLGIFFRGGAGSDGACTCATRFASTGRCRDRDAFSSLAVVVRRGGGLLGADRAEAHLSRRCGELFAVENEVLLYDVTSTP
jgi:hypothetical protein